ncbi:hypothetical protein H5V45_07875 [Nocardioides sp. KIGAM211]|uniref:Glycoside-hydrolase family GH114 TIM-barrel domain-containing protein n=1 Tax=Nocardioides luti TaxID=2761101 RepID=A0A7X0VBJ3_9ACTN|nr:putative glycoside hydrolase [Nocardioides luti]MBB6627238.1 hypothetical protein [Nocardioides luti]
MRILDALGVALTLVLVSLAGDSTATVAAPRPAQHDVGHADLTLDLGGSVSNAVATAGTSTGTARPLARTAVATSTKATSKTARAAAPRRTTSEGSAGTLMLDWGDPDSTPEAWKGNYVVIQPWEYDLIPVLKAKNPDVQVLMYKDVSATVAGACRDAACTLDNRILPTGVGYHWAMRHHPGWFLRDAAGRQLEWSDWPGLYPMDVSRPAYARRWSGNVLRELRAHDWDGVMLDDVLTELSHTVFDNRVSTRISTDAQMYAATEKFLSRVGPGLQAAGYQAITNIAFQWDDWRSVVEDWSPYVSGWENEYFVKWGLSDDSGRFTGADWEWKMQLAAWCAQRGMPLLAVTYSTTADVASQVYHRATWLLTWNGRTGSSIFVPDEEFTNHWLSAPTIEIGQPAGPRERLPSGIWRREYAGGMVLVNPSSTAQRIALGRSYRTANGRRVDSVRLAPATASILRN